VLDMAAKINEVISGTWIHCSDEDLAPFFNVVGKLTFSSIISTASFFYISVLCVINVCSKA